MDSEFRGTDRFEVKRRLGQGGFGVVYEGYDRRRDEMVAIKVLHEKSGDALYRLKREFRSLAGIQHKNLVSLHELVCHNDQWFIIMELVRGKDFSTYVRGPLMPAISRRLGTGGGPAPDSSPTTSVPSPFADSGKSDHPNTEPDQEAMQALAQTSLKVRAGLLSTAMIGSAMERIRGATQQLAEGLSALHAAGKLHCDIKPSNVLVSESGRVVVLDFGLVTERTGGEAEKYDAGTPAYMAPEGFEENVILGPAYDWYSVGIMLYQALTGEVPFKERTWHALRIHKQRLDPFPPRQVLMNQLEMQDGASDGILDQLCPVDLESLCMQMLARNPQERPDRRGVLARLTGSAKDESHPPVIVPASFVGRTPETNVLQEAFEGTKHGAVVVHVYGPSGIGKSAVVRHFLTDLESGKKVTVLRGRCFQRESVPYKLLDQLVDSLCSHLMQAAPEAASISIHIQPESMFALLQVFPVLERVEAFRDAASSLAMEIEDSAPVRMRRRAYRALRDVFSALVRRGPTVLYLDDVQWGDLDSVEVLDELFRPPEPPALLVIFGYRGEAREGNVVVERLLYPGHVDLPIGPLREDEARRLAAQLLKVTEKDSRLVDSIIAESKCHPFFLLSLVTHAMHLHLTSASDLGQVTLQEALQARFSALPPEAQRLLEVMVVAGKPTERDVLRRAAHLDSTEQVILQLESAQLIQLTGEEQDRLEIFHDQVRDGCMKLLQEQQIVGFHRNLAEAMESVGSADPDTLLAHWEGAQEPHRAVPYAILAAEQAAKALAFDRAAQRYRRALQILPEDVPNRVVLLKGYADALASAGRSGEAGDQYAALATRVGTGDQLKYWQKAAGNWLRSGYAEKGLDALQNVLAFAGMKLPSRSEAMFLIPSRRMQLSWRGYKFVPRDEKQIPYERLQRIDVCWEVATGLLYADVVRAIAFQTQHLQLALQAGEPSRVGYGMALAAILGSTTGLPVKHKTASILEKAKEISKNHENPRLAGFLEAAEGIAAYFQGRFMDIAAGCARARDTLRKYPGTSWEAAIAGLYLMYGLKDTGEWAAFSEHLFELLAEAADHGDRFLQRNMLLLAHLHALARDDLPLAQEFVDQANAIPLAKDDAGLFGELIARAQIALYAGNGREALRIVDERGPVAFRSVSMVQVSRVKYYWLEVCCVLAAAEPIKPGEEQRELLNRASAVIKKMEREKTPYGDSMAQSLRAVVAAFSGKDVVAEQEMRKASERFRAEGINHFAAAADRWRGTLIGGVEGVNLIRNSDQELIAQKVRDPLRMASRVLLPGLPQN